VTTQAAPSPSDVARVFVGRDAAAVREAAAEIGADPLVVATAGAKLLAGELLRRNRTCRVGECSNVIERGESACAACTERRARLDADAAKFWSARGCPACAGRDAKHRHQLAAKELLERALAATGVAA
jgi:hypothetical protein